MTARVVLSAATVESLEFDVRCSEDPTGTPPGCALTPLGTYATPATVFTDGAWDGAWTAGGWLVARTPTFGDSLPITAGTQRWLWVRVTAGGEAAVWLVGTIAIV